MRNLQSMAITLIILRTSGARVFGQLTGIQNPVWIIRRSMRHRPPGFPDFSFCLVSVSRICH